jgi:predicted hotdog family 3-hydroxylacyl-ACP dehydratase
MPYEFRLEWSYIFFTEILLNISLLVFRIPPHSRLRLSETFRRRDLLLDAATGRYRAAGFFSSTMKVKATRAAETSVDSRWSLRVYIPGDRTLPLCRPHIQRWSAWSAQRIRTAVNLGFLTGVRHLRHKSGMLPEIWCMSYLHWTELGTFEGVLKGIMLWGLLETSIEGDQSSLAWIVGVKTITSRERELAYTVW